MLLSNLRLLFNELIPRHNPKPRENFPDLFKGKSLIKPKFRLEENLFSLS